MTIHLSNVYTCSYCPAEISKEEDGIIVFGSLCVIGERGLKAKTGSVPTDHNVRDLGGEVTPVCRKCLLKKLKALMVATS